jgi:hypothetical protein
MDVATGGGLANQPNSPHLSAVKLPFAHLHPAYAKLPCTSVQRSVTFLVCYGGTFNFAPTNEWLNIFMELAPVSFERIRKNCAAALVAGQ